MIKSNFNGEPIDILEMIENERFLYIEIIELKNNIIQLKKQLKEVKNYIKK